MSIELETVPLEDWFEELADESLDPLNILMDEEENETETYTGDTTMSTTTLNKTPDFNVDAWLKLASVVTNQPDVKSTAVVACPEWLTLKSGLVTESNAFVVTAGVIKAARQVMDAISYTRLQYEAAIEDLHMQERRAHATGLQADPSGPQGFNPDGNEYDNAVQEATEAVERLEVILDNGKRITAEILQWVVDNASALNLKVATGYTVRTGIIGQEIRTQRCELLTPETLMYGIAEQRDFIRNARA
jgi:hypothetical protein